MSRAEIQRIFNVSMGSITNILRESRDKREREAENLPVPKRAKSGPKSPFDNFANIALLLDFIETDPAITLKEMVEKLKGYNIETSDSAIDR